MLEEKNFNQQYKIPIKNNNSMNYKKIYDSLINKWKTIDESLIDKTRYLEKHHIIPRCMGGSDDEENIISMYARDHIIAHMLLSLIYPDNNDLAFAVVSLSMNSKFTTGRVEERSRVSSRMFEFFRIRAGSLQKGKRLSDTHRKNLSKPKPSLRVKRPIVVGKKISNGKKGKSYGTKVIDTNTGKIYSTIEECSKDIGYNASTIKYWITNIPSRGFSIYTGQTNIKANHPRARKVIGPDGTIYSSITECASKTGHDRHAISEWIKSNPQKGYSYLSDKTN